MIKLFPNVPLDLHSNLSPVREDDAESEDAEDEESPRAGRDDEKVDGRRRTVRGGAVLHCLEVRHTWEGQCHDKHISSQANTFNRIKYNLLVPDLSLSLQPHIKIPRTTKDDKIYFPASPST